MIVGDIIRDCSDLRHNLVAFFGLAKIAKLTVG